MYTTIAFVVYSLIMFLDSILNTTQMAYTDSRTGLANKARWNEMMGDRTTVPNAVGVMMLDMNALKEINDTYGHEVGDRVIFDFSNILRNTLPANSLICRWGGDEFAVMLTGMTQEKLEKLTASLHSVVDTYNKVSDSPSIFFAIGYALSSDYPGLSGKELLSVADSQMYLDKQEWYSARESKT